MTDEKLRRILDDKKLCMMRLRVEIARLTLTDAERAAVESCISDDEAATAYTRAATLRALLERLNGDT